MDQLTQIAETLDSGKIEAKDNLKKHMYESKTDLYEYGQITDGVDSCSDDTRLTDGSGSTAFAQVDTAVSGSGTAVGDTDEAGSRRVQDNRHTTSTATSGTDVRPITTVDGSIIYIPTTDTTDTAIAGTSSTGLTDQDLEAFAQLTVDGVFDDVEKKINSIPDKHDNKDPVNMCCSTPMRADKHGGLTCPKCGAMQENTNSELLTNYSSECLSKSKYNTDYASTRRKLIFDTLREKQDKSPNGLVFTNEVLGRACDICVAILEIKTRRNNVLKQIIAASLFKAAAESTYAVKRSQIAKYMGITSMPLGESILDDMNRDGNIVLTQNVDFVSGYLSGWCANLLVPDKDKPTVMYAPLLPYVSLGRQIVKISMEKHIGSDSKLASKCAGALWLMVLALGVKVKDDEIDEMCDIRKPTFLKYCKQIDMYKSHFVKAFADHGLKYVSTTDKPTSKSTRTAKPKQVGLIA